MVRTKLTLERNMPSSKIILVLGALGVGLMMLWWLSNCNEVGEITHATENVRNSERVHSADELKLFANGYSDLDNEQFLSFIRQRWLVGPASEDRPWHLSKPETSDYSQVGQSSFVDEILMEKRNGFFIECGAADGELFSNTLYFEKRRGWSGLLVEANPTYFKSILSKNRKAYAINAGLSTTPNTAEIRFKAAGVFGGISDKMDKVHWDYVNTKKSSDITVTCFPLYAILKAIGQTHVDYFSLDVEGPELDILISIPFNKITIDVISVEYRVSDMVNIIQPETLRKLKKVRRFFTKLGGYDEVGILPWKKTFTNKTEAESIGLDILYKRRKDAEHRQIINWKG